MEQCQIVRYYGLHRVSHEHLVAEELDFVAADFHLVLDFREVEDAGEGERVVHVEVDVEERLLGHRIEG